MPVANVDCPRYAAEIAALQQKYAGKITLRMGMEFGMQAHTIPQYETWFSACPFDFILLSVHQVEDREFWNGASQAGRHHDDAGLCLWQIPFLVCFSMAVPPAACLSSRSA